MKKLLLLLLLFSCVKEERRNWLCTQSAVAYPDSKCKCDSIIINVAPWREIDKTNQEIIEIQAKYTFKAWGHINNSKDSAWIVSKCNCGVLVCQ
jgi:hypothetical protein